MDLWIPLNIGGYLAGYRTDPWGHRIGTLKTSAISATRSGRAVDPARRDDLTESLSLAGERKYRVGPIPAVEYQILPNVTILLEPQVSRSVLSRFFRTTCNFGRTRII